MCMCGKPTINGQPGYSWDGKSFGIRPVAPPDLAEGDKLLFDEPGRCGGLDGHCHHFRVVKGKHGGNALLVRHGGGDERIPLTCVGDLFIKGNSLGTLDSTARYWLLYTIFSVQREATTKAREAVTAKWSKAAAEKRIKTRKNRGQGTVKVWIEDSKVPA